MLTGKSGWFKRINRDYNTASKRSKLTDDHEICEDATDKIHAAAKNVVLKRKQHSVAIPAGNLPFPVSRDFPSSSNSADISVSKTADDDEKAGQVFFFESKLST